MMSMIVAAGAADPERGWGNIWGLLAGIAVAGAIWIVDIRRQNKGKGSGDDHSPALSGVPDPRETAQVTSVSSHPSHETGEDDGGDWYGRIVRRGNRVYRTVRHITRTGESPAGIDNGNGGPAVEPSLPEAYEPPDDEADIDIPFGYDDEPEPEPQPETRKVVRRETREQYAQRCLRDGVPRPQIVEGLQRHYGLSRAQAYRVAGPTPRAGRAA